MVKSVMDIFVADPLIVINLSPSPSAISSPSNMVKSFPAPTIEIFEVESVILSSVIPVPQVPAATLIVVPFGQLH